MKKRLIAGNLLLILLLVSFIWFNSFLPASESSKISSGVLQWLVDTFSFIPFTEHIVRKLGHFLEFAALGCLLANLLRLMGERGVRHFALALLPGVLTAMTDETIQLFSEGRSSEVLDVWIDTTGCTCGILFLMIFATLFLKGNKRI